MTTQDRLGEDAERTLSPTTPSHGFDAFFELDADELETLAGLPNALRRYGKNETIRSEGEPVQEIFILHEGWVTTGVASSDGGFQIIQVHLPGDMMGTPSVVLAKAAETLTAITPAVISKVPLARLGRLFAERPRLAAALFLASQQERIFLMDVITSVGRRSALQRVAAFLLHLFERWQSIDPATGSSLFMPLTQEHMGNALGLSAVHVNRMLHQLEERRMIARSSRQIVFLDVEGLRHLADLPQRLPSPPRWLGLPA